MKIRSQRAGFVKWVLATACLLGSAHSAAAFELKPYKDRLFAYPRTLQSKDGGKYRIVDYRELRDINGRDQIPEKRVKRKYVDYAARRATRQASLSTQAGAISYFFAGNTRAPRVVTVYIHGIGGSGKQGVNDHSFGGNFNRIKMLMLKNNGLYLSPDAEAYGSGVAQRISAVIQKHTRNFGNRRVVLACGSQGGEICHRLADNATIAPQLAGILFLGSFWSEKYLTSLAVTAGVPTFIGHGSNDTVFAIENMERFYNQIRETGSPVQMVRFETGTHGTPLRMTDWRRTINWMMAHK